MEQAPAVVLEKRNPFKGDEVDALVSVCSNVLSSILVGGLFQLLRSGVSHSILRRLWNQFRISLQDETNYVQATSRKMETLVIVSQTLYSRLLRRVQNWCKNLFFSINFRDDGDGVCCSWRCLSASALCVVCVFWETFSAGICDDAGPCFALSWIISRVSLALLLSIQRV